MAYKKGKANVVAKCDESNESESFSLAGINEFEEFLSSLYPISDNLKAKIREQLQLLTDDEEINKS